MCTAKIYETECYLAELPMNHFKFCFYEKWRLGFGDKNAYKIYRKYKTKYLVQTLLKLYKIPQYQHHIIKL